MDNVEKAEDKVGNEVNVIEGQVEHHLGLALISLAWIALFFEKVRGSKVRLPGYFFVLYGLGCIVLAFGMFKKIGSLGSGPAIHEAIIGILSVFFYFTM